MKSVVCSCVAPYEGDTTPIEELIWAVAGISKAAGYDIIEQEDPVEPVKPKPDEPEKPKEEEVIGFDVTKLIRLFGKWPWDIRWKEWTSQYSRLPKELKKLCWDAFKVGSVFWLLVVLGVWIF
jgi:hypothetical protein